MCISLLCVLKKAAEVWLFLRREERFNNRLA